LKKFEFYRKNFFRAILEFFQRSGAGKGAAAQREKDNITGIFMRELIDSTHAFGFEINKSSYTYAEVVKKRGQIQIIAVNTLPLEDQKIDSELGARADNSLIVLGLESGDCLIRNLQIPLKKDADVNEALPFQAEPLIPFPLEDAVLDWIKVSQDSKGTALTFAAAKKEAIAKALKGASDLGLEPEVLSSQASALAAYSKHFIKLDEPHIMLHIGEETSLFALVSQGKLIAAQGSKHTNTAEITRTIFGLAKLMKGESVEKTIVTGHYSPALFKDLETTLIFADDALHAIAIGLALQGLDPETQINFRQKEFAYPRPLKRVVKPLSLYLAACLALSIALYFLGSSYFSYRENGLRESYVALLESMNKTYQEGESDFAGIKESQETFQPPDIYTLTAESIDERMGKLEKAIKIAPDFIALSPNVPRVADVLAWITSHQNIGLTADSEKVAIDHLSYALIKRPEEKKRDVKYQAKVELEFTSVSPKVAREFHDSLIAPNDMVDPKGEIKWSSTRGKYRASFILKDKTFYPAERRS